MYTPPFTISAKAINRIAEISAQLELYVIRMEQADGIRLRKVNRMKTIHGTLAIEGNTLTYFFQEVRKMYATTGIIQGNTVLTDDYTLENYNGKKVIITVLDDEKQFSTVSDEKLFSVSDSLINQNIEAYKELAK